VPERKGRLGWSLERKEKKITLACAGWPSPEIQLKQAVVLSTPSISNQALLSLSNHGSISNITALFSHAVQYRVQNTSKYFFIPHVFFLFLLLCPRPPFFFNKKPVANMLHRHFTFFSLFFFTLLQLLLFCDQINQAFSFL